MYQTLLPTTTYGSPINLYGSTTNDDKGRDNGAYLDNADAPRENTTLNLPGLLNTNGGAVAEHGLSARRKKTTLMGGTNAAQRMTTVGETFFRPG